MFLQIAAKSLSSRHSPSRPVRQAEPAGPGRVGRTQAPSRAWVPGCLGQIPALPLTSGPGSCLSSQPHFLRFPARIKMVPAFQGRCDFEMTHRLYSPQNITGSEQTLFCTPHPEGEASALHKCPRVPPLMTGRAETQSRSPRHYVLPTECFPEF